VIRVLVIAVWLAACHHDAAVTLAGPLENRHYEVYVPPNLPPGRPLVVVLHGNGGDGHQMRRFAHFDDLAARDGFVVAYPDGIGRHWNDGRPELATDVDDVEFLRALIEDLAVRYAVDRRRIYVTGMSNGAIMAYRLACEMSDRIAAIAPVAGELDEVPACASGPPISVLAINGTADPIVPFAGGVVGRNRGHVHAAGESVAVFARRAGCSIARASEDLPDNDPDDNTRSQRTRYTECQVGLAVDLVTVENGGHTWPGAQQYLPKGLIGPVSRDFDASVLIWQFFVAHPHT
jgi:polyhydroxybutyrate depolymerase